MIFYSVLLTRGIEISFDHSKSIFILPRETSMLVLFVTSEIQLREPIYFVYLFRVNVSIHLVLTDLLVIYIHYSH